MTNFQRGLRAGAIGGLVILTTLAAGSLLQSAPGGSGDRIEWLYTYGFAVGFPLTLALSALAQAIPSLPNEVMAAVFPIALILNWTLFGGLLGLIADRVRPTK